MWRDSAVLLQGSFLNANLGALSGGIPALDLPPGLAERSRQVLELAAVLQALQAKLELKS